MRSFRVRRGTALLLTLALLLPSARALTLDQAQELLEEKYIGGLPEQALTQETIEDLVAALGDPYTRYLTAEEYQAFLDSLSDTRLVGAGVAVSLEEGLGLRVERALDGSPAQEAGISAGDLIIAVDGQSTAEADSLETVSGWLQGEEGSEVTLTLLRGETTQTLTLVRRSVTVPRTTAEPWGNSTVYLNCTAFGGDTYGHFAGALENYGGTSKWVVDLRENSGGMLQGSADAVGVFVGSGTVALLQDSAGQYLRCVPGEDGAHTLYPVLVLTGENTASAAELFASAVRDQRGGLVIGQRTFGKGLAQEVLDQTRYPDYFPEGDALLVSSMRFYSAGQTTTDQVGVIPHLVVDPALTEDVAALLGTVSPGDDNAAWLRLHLGGWRWYLNTELAADYLPAFTELLEAIHPLDDLFQGTGNGGWAAVDVDTLAARYAPDYTPRTFADADGSPYETAIDALAVYGLIQGTDTGGFEPEGVFTRAQFCALLAQVMNLRQSGELSFSDVPEDAWYAGAVTALCREGLIEGAGDGLFRPDDPISHEQLAVLLARTAAWLNAAYADALRAGPVEGALDDPVLTAFSPWAREGAWLTGRSVQNFFGEYLSLLYDDLEYIDPQAVTTRGEAAEALYRVLTYTGVLQG